MVQAIQLHANAICGCCPKGRRLVKEIGKELQRRPRADSLAAGYIGVGPQPHVGPVIPPTPAGEMPGPTNRQFECGTNYSGLLPISLPAAPVPVR